MTNNKPIKVFNAGSVQVAIWTNLAKTKEGKHVAFDTISIKRGYKDADNKWQSTSTMKLSDLPKLMVVLQEAYKHLVLKGDVVETSFQEAKVAVKKYIEENTLNGVTYQPTEKELAQAE